MPGKAEGYCEPKGAADWVRNPNGRGNGWRDANGDVWVPTGPGGEAHGGPTGMFRRPAVAMSMSTLAELGGHD